MERRQAPPRLAGVEMMRGVAALAVVVAHAAETAGNMGARVSGGFLPAIPAANDIGASGVDLFFVISGFVMAHLMAREAPSPADFVRRRVHRIMPLFLLVSLAYAALLAPIGWRPTAGGIANTLTLLPLFDGATYSVPPLFVGWTLAFEAAFYLLVLLVLASGVARRREALLAVTAAAAAIGAAAHPGWMAMRILFNPIMAEFALGVIVHLCWEQGWGGVYARRALIVLLAGFVLAVAVRPVELGFSVHFAFVIDGTSGARRFALWGVPWALLLLSVIDPPGAGGRARAGLRRMGAASYSLYLGHPIVMLLVPGWVAAGWVVDVYAMVAVLVGASVALALATHRFVERPLLAWRAGGRRAAPGYPAASIVSG